MCTMSSLRTVCLGFWLLGILCLSFGTSMVAYGTFRATTGKIRPYSASANLSECLNFSKYLRIEADKSLKQFQQKETFINCSMKEIHIPNPNNEAKIQHACINGQSKLELCSSGKNDTVNQTLCMETIHGILASYKEVRHSKSLGFPKLLDAVNDMLQALKINNKTLEEAPNKPSEYFNAWKEQCKFFLTFQLLTQTINRIMTFLRDENSKQNA